MLKNNGKISIKVVNSTKKIKFDKIRQNSTKNAVFLI